MNKYDKDIPPDEKPPIPPCVHNFEDDTEIYTKYSRELCNKVIEHGRKGLFIEGFAGRYNICMDKICEWLSNPKEYSEFNSAVKVSISASIHFWNEALLHALTNYDICGSAVPVIRNILADIMKSTPTALREGLFNNLNQQSAGEKQKEAELQQAAAFMANVTGKLDETN